MMLTSFSLGTIQQFSIYILSRPLHEMMKLLFTLFEQTLFADERTYKILI